ncbi:MAG: carbamate kinase, partial [Thermoplasmata archaeon]
MERMVIALGGNALLRNGEKRNYAVQYSHAIEAFENIYDIIAMNQVVITHGNGPQVGDILLSHEKSGIPASLHECGAMSEGFIGEILTNAYEKVRIEKGISKEMLTVITRTIVDKDDPAFKNPTKPIGKYYDDQSAEDMKKNGWVMKKTKDGWRRVVPSPDPKDIVEIDGIRTLMMSGYVPLAAGGGGIPVIKNGNMLMGVDAVIDKDLASSLLARNISADTFVILTDVDHVYLNYGKPNEKKLENVSVKDMIEYEKEGQFAEGSMGPKVRATINFLSGGGKKAIITSLERAREAISK